MKNVCPACRKDEATEMFKESGLLCPVCYRAASYLWEVVGEDKVKGRFVLPREIEARNAFIYSVLTTEDGSVPGVAWYEELCYKQWLKVRKHYSEKDKETKS